MRRILFFLLFTVAMLSLPAAAKRWTHGFRVAKLRLAFPHRSEWETPYNPDIDALLKQPFHFIGKGAQAYVFESSDGQYVVKLFRYDQPDSEEKIVHLFNACKLAFDDLREETGLVYIHLNPTSFSLPTFRCKDAVGRAYEIPLDRVRFAVQKKALPFRAVLEQARHNPDEMKKRLDQFLSLLQARTAKGILNSDPNLSRNFGFLEDRAIEFDFGNFSYRPELNRKGEVERFASRLRRWLAKYDPEWVSYLDEHLDAL